MSQKLPVDNFQYKKKHQKLVKDTYLKLMLNIINICMSNTMIYHFYLKKMRIKKCHNFLCHIYDQKKYALHIRTFKKELNHELFFKKVQKARLKPYSQVNTKLRTKRLEYIIQFLKRKD